MMQRPIRLYFAALLVLALGLGTAALIYLNAEDDSGTGQSYVIANGEVYAVNSADLKPYRRELQRFGGKAALLFDDFDRWFAGLWRGKSLAVTVAWIGVVVSLAILFVAVRLESEPLSTASDAPDQRGAESGSRSAGDASADDAQAGRPR